MPASLANALAVDARASEDLSTEPDEDSADVSSIAEAGDAVDGVADVRRACRRSALRIDTRGQRCELGSRVAKVVAILMAVLAIAQLPKRGERLCRPRAARSVQWPANSPTVPAAGDDRGAQADGVEPAGRGVPEGRAQLRDATSLSGVPAVSPRVLGRQGCLDSALAAASAGQVRQRRVMLKCCR